MEEAEKLYPYTQSQQIMAQTGCIGHLRADMDRDGNGFFTSWDDHMEQLETAEFKAELDQVINALRIDEEGGKIFENRNALSKFCFAHTDAAIGSDGHDFGFRTDTEKYAYLFRLNPNRGEYNIYCYCYLKERLDNHIKAAAKGIRFIDPHYNNLFRIPDGGMIRITYSDGKREDRQCRFIDGYHLQIGDGPGSIYHICEYAERNELRGVKAEPLTPMPEPIKKRKAPARDAER